MHMQISIWKDENEKWQLTQEIWKGGSWGSYWKPIGNIYDTKEQAIEAKRRYDAGEATIKTASNIE